MCGLREVLDFAYATIFTTDIKVVLEIRRQNLFAAIRTFCEIRLFYQTDTGRLTTGRTPRTVFSVFFEFRNMEIHPAIWTRSQETPYGSHKFESVMVSW